MKKTLLTTVLIIIAFAALNAQISGNRSMLGVSTSFSFFNTGSDLLNLGFTTTNADGSEYETKATTFSIMPRFGYFFTNNLAVGLNAAYAVYSLKDKAGYTNKMSLFGIGPFIRYYFNGTKVMPYLEVTSLFGNIKENSDLQYKLSSLGGGAGLAVKIGEKVTFDMMASYNHITEKEESASGEVYKTFQKSLGFKFGFTILFGTNVEK